MVAIGDVRALARGARGAARGAHLVAGLLAALAAEGGPVLAQDSDPGAAEPVPITITVNPSGFQPAESLEQKLERRLRQSDYLFRSICNGCVHQEVASRLGGTFDPQRSLDASRRGR